MLEHYTAKSWKGEVVHIPKWLEPKVIFYEQINIEKTAKSLEFVARSTQASGEDYDNVFKVDLWAEMVHLYDISSKEVTLTHFPRSWLCNIVTEYVLKLYISYVNSLVNNINNHPNFDY